MCPSVTIDDMPHGSGGKDGMSEYVATLDGLERRLDGERLDAIRTCDKIRLRIQRLEDARERDVLEYRYLHMEDWKSIGLIMGLSERRILEIHSDALFHFIL